MQVAQAAQRAVLRHLEDTAAETLRNVRPDELLVLAPDRPVKRHPHVRRLGVAEANGGERHCHLQHPAIVGDAALAAINALPVPVGEHQALVGNQRVALGAERVELENVGRAIVAIAVEPDDDAVVEIDATFPLQDLRDDPLGLRVVQHEAEVDVVGIERHAHLGGLRGHRAVDRVALTKVGHRLGNTPHFVVEHAVDDGRCRGEHGDDRGIVGRCVIASRSSGIARLSRRLLPARCSH